MRPNVSMLVILLNCVTTVVSAQGVMIARATPEAVVENLKMKLVPQGFQFERGNQKSALFSLDRGMVAQQGNQYVQGALVHIVIELTVRFKQRQDSLQVTADEVVVGNPRARAGFRKPVESRAERDNMQRLLDGVKADLEGRQPRDSTSSRDSTEFR